MELYYEIAEHLDRPLDDDLVMAIEAACITRADWNYDIEDCVQRIRGAEEELYGTA